MLLRNSKDQWLKWCHVKMIGIFLRLVWSFLIRIIIGCIYGEGINAAKECALKQPRRRLSGTSRRDDVAPELGSGHDGGLIYMVGSHLTLSHDVDTKHVAYQKSDMELAQRPANMEGNVKIYQRGMCRVFSINVIVDGVLNTDRLPSWLIFIPAKATEERFLQMDDIIEDGHKFCFLHLPLKGGMTLQSIEVSLNRHGIWHEAGLDRSGKETNLVEADSTLIGMKPKSQQEDILRYLYINWQTLQHNSSDIEALKETNLVTSADEQSRDLYKPKDLFDLGDALLTSVFSGEVQKFPGKMFASDGWLNILRKISHQNTCDADAVLGCARRVEYLGVQSMKPFELVDDKKEYFRNVKGEVPFRIWSLAKTLISVIFENFDALYSNNFCNILAKIVCVPAEEGSPFGSRKKSVKRVLCLYSNTFLLKDWRLAWNTAAILSRETLVPPKYSWGALQLKSPPPFAIVLKHLQAVLHTDSFLFASEEASFEVLKFLDSIWDSLSSSDIFKLKQVAFIAVDNETRLVTCHSLFAHMPINLSPLASKLPPCYLPFMKVLKELGSEDMLSISSAMNILRSLRISCGYQRLNPNELHAVIEILHFLCNEIKGQQTSDRPNWVSELVVPDDGCRLVPANFSVYIDPYASQYVKFIDSSKLKFVHRDVSERVCLAFGISKLSDIVVEELDYVQHLQTAEENIGSVPSSAIKQKLLSRSFQVAVSRVLNTLSSNTKGSEHLSFETLQRSLESVAQRLQFVQNIYSRFWLLPKSLDVTQTSEESIVPEWESGSIYRALYYVDRSNSCMLIAKPPSYISIIDLVAIVVSHVLGSTVPLPIGLLFTCPQDSEIALVNILKLSYDERVTDSVGCGISFLGREVDPEDAEKSFLDSPRGFYRGEIVAWGCKEEKKLKYSRIVEDVTPPGDHRIYKINLETSPGKTETTYSSLVYKIKDYPISDEYEADVMIEYVDNALNIEDIEQPAGLLINQVQTIKEFVHGQISVEELIFALEEMLADDRIGMDMEKQHLLLTTLSLQERLKESQAALLLEQEKSELAIKEADMAKTALLCRLCLTNEIDITVVPCGHVLCLRCASAISCCPVCRVQLSNTIKIYWP